VTKNEEAASSIKLISLIASAFHRTKHAIIKKSLLFTLFAIVLLFFYQTTAGNRYLFMSLKTYRLQKVNLITLNGNFILFEE
jgi:LPS O-antigen subunit length determinant protein (WzzB/FepE family)